VAFPPRPPDGDDRGGHREPRAPAAARRRDREVPARDVLLQRRGGGAVPRASGGRWPRARATCRPTTTSPR
jgi:hypothetical protein